MNAQLAHRLAAGVADLRYTLRTGQRYRRPRRGMTREIAGAWCIVSARGFIIRAASVEHGAQLVWVAER